ncbi:MAG: Mur ligase family protein [Pseudomonadota bacterium]|nr:Mur ligase family protein [Pseudomonadota bacterium]
MIAGDRRPDRQLQRLLGLHPKLIDLTLDRMWRILAALDHPERRLPPTIHIAGTNGKGSTLAFLRALGEVAGLRVHAYISPHLIRFNERIELAGQAIDDDALSEILDRAERANDGAAITFFEITTAAALTAFADTPADLLILETGLGGRLDSTNVLARPMAHVITPISIDHQRFLGDDLATIADAKAGILRPGVPAVIGPQPPAAARVIAAEAAKLGAPLFRHGAEWAVAAASSAVIRGGFQFTWRDQIYDLPAPALAGGHQYLNAGAALAAAHVANALPAGHRPRFDLRPAAVAEALATVRWPGRLQKLSHGPLTAGLPAGAEVWLDGGHNAGGAAVLAAQIEEWRAATPERPVVLVYGSLNSHRPEDFFAALTGLNLAVRTVTIPGQENALEAAEIAARLAAAGIAAAATTDVSTAVRSLMDTHPRARVLICGSLYLAGHVLAENS